MSKERILLEKFVSWNYEKGAPVNLFGSLINEAEKLLAQPEQDLDDLKKDWVNFGYTAGKMEAPPEQEPEFDIHFMGRIDVYAEKHPSRLVRQLASRLRDVWNETKQEPVAYAYDYLDSLYYSDDKDVADYPRISRDGRALYTSPPTREPLSDAQILDLFIGIGVGATTEIKLSVARAIEKAHGIGVDNDK